MFLFLKQFFEKWHHMHSNVFDIEEVEHVLSTMTSLARAAYGNLDAAIYDEILRAEAMLLKLQSINNSNENDS